MTPSGVATITGFTDTTHVGASVLTTLPVLCLGAFSPLAARLAQRIGSERTLLGVILLLGLAGSTSSVVTFILAGVILNSLAGAGVAVALSLAPNPWAVGEIINWMMGSLADRSLTDLQMGLPFILAGCGLILTTGRALDALSLGEAGARSLGINMAATRWCLALGVGLATGHLEAALTAYAPVHEVWLNSPGGNSRVGTEMGEILRSEMIATRVRKGHGCASACSTALRSDHDEIR